MDRLPPRYRPLRSHFFKNRLVVGHAARNDIHLGAQFVRRRHAVILTDERGTLILDWGRKSGVFKTGFRTSEQPLHNGYKVWIGTVDFRYKERLERWPGDRAHYCECDHGKSGGIASASV